MSNVQSMHAAARAFFPEWPCLAMLPGEWREVPMPLVKKFLVQCGRIKPGARLPAPIARMRALRLPFYDGWFLLEGQSCHSVAAVGLFRLLLGRNRYLLLDGESTGVHAHNSVHLALKEDAGLADAYLRFFTTAIRGEEGPFRIVESIDDFEPFEQIVPAARPRLPELLSPIKRLEDEDGCWVRKACVLYGGHLFEARFRIQRSGMVEMLDDKPLFTDAVTGSAHYDGIWQIIPGARHNASTGLSKGERP